MKIKLNRKIRLQMQTGQRFESVVNEFAATSDGAVLREIDELLNSLLAE